MSLTKRYENTEDGHSKFWEITKLSNGKYKASWGRIGKEPQGNKDYTVDEIQKIVNSKIKKGYKKIN